MQASHQEVLGKVSAILQNHDVGPTGKEFCIEDLNWFDCFLVSAFIVFIFLYM
jgi:hypothetical protein